MADVIAEAERSQGLSVAAHIDRTNTGFELLAAGYPNWKADILSASGLFGLEFDNVQTSTGIRQRIRAPRMAESEESF